MAKKEDKKWAVLLTLEVQDTEPELQKAGIDRIIPVFETKKKALKFAQGDQALLVQV